jgi:hypothetical protein
MKIQSSRAIALALLLTLAVSACTDKKLRDLVNASDKIAETVTVVQKAAVDSENANLVTRNQARAIMQLSIQVSQANNSAMDIARDLSKLDEPSREQLLEVLKPIIAAVNAGVNDQNILGIQDVKTRDAIRGGFVAIQTTLASINLILSSSH